MERESLDKRDGFRYILVIISDLSFYVWLEPAEVCSTATTTTVKHLFLWFQIVDIPEVWMNDTVTHFRNKVMSTFGGSL